VRQDSTRSPEVETPTGETEPEQEPTGELPPMVEVGRPGFRALPEQETDPEPPPWSDAAAAWAPGSGDGGEPGAATDAGPATTMGTIGSSRGSIASALLQPLVTIVGMVTMLVHTLRTPGENEVWMATPDELVGIGQPLARIAARRIPKGLDSGRAGDLSDGLEAAFGATAYTLRNIDAEREWKATRGYVPAPGPTAERPPRRSARIRKRRAAERFAPPPEPNGDQAQAEPEVVPPPNPLDVLRGVR
jgi:hypothetical protein